MSGLFVAACDALRRPQLPGRIRIARSGEKKEPVLHGRGPHLPNGAVSTEPAVASAARWRCTHEHDTRTWIVSVVFAR
jgi:hypothetical protein